MRRSPRETGVLIGETPRRRRQRAGLDTYSIVAMRDRLLTGGVIVLTSSVIVGALAAPRLPAHAPQTSAQKRPTFEVVSIKRATAIERGGGTAGLQPGGRFVMTNGPARVLINWAYPSVTREIVGAPDWVTYENYDVDARAGGEVSQEQLALMLRSLLADRFKLEAHFETRVRPMYELRVVRADGVLGPGMRLSKTDCEPRPASCTTRGGAGVIDSNGISMAAFITWLPGPLGRPVIDKTGLSGSYELLLRYSPTDSGDLPSLPTALREQLGLTLEPIQGPIDVLVLDHIERPTPN
jgi:uncharacterized protein (TIGR03435 family)